MTDTAIKSIYTIGHSTHELSEFIRLLQQHRIEAIADVRSIPYSRRLPQFDRESLRDALLLANIKYVFLGKELGARSNDPACRDENNRVLYRKLAKTTLFLDGIRRVCDGAQRMRIALMCAEKEPLECHRTILIARELVEDGNNIIHILGDGQLETHEETMKRLCVNTGYWENDLFTKNKDLLDLAYSKQELLISGVEIEHLQ